MEARLVPVEDLKRGDRPISQLLEAFIYETNYVNRYNAANIYNKGNLIFIENETTKYPEIYEAISDNITGVFNPVHWKRISLLSMIKSVTENNIVVSDTDPLIDETSIWIKPTSRKKMMVPASLL